MSFKPIAPFAENEDDLVHFLKLRNDDEYFYRSFEDLKNLILESKEKRDKLIDELNLSNFFKEREMDDMQRVVISSMAFSFPINNVVSLTEKELTTYSATTIKRYFELKFRKGELDELR